MLKLETERRSSLALLPGIIDQPVRTLGEVMAHSRWRWGLPALLAIIGLTLSMVFSAPYLSEQAKQQQAVALQQVESQMSDLTEAQRAQMEERIAMFTSPLVVGGMGLVTGLLGMVAGWLVGAAILYFGFQITAREATFGQVFAGFTWTWLPFFLRDLVNAAWVVTAGKLITNPGLSYFFATGDQLADARSPLWVLASKLDLFMLWHFVLIYFLIRAASQRGGGLGLALVYAVLTLALRVLPAIGLTSLVPGG